MKHSTKWTQRSDNHLLRGNEYHDPDHSMKSGLDVIDFPMHWNFDSASGAFSVHGEDWRYNDATYNVVYVDSHDYAPCGDDTHRFHRGTDVWAENLDLMFTFRGIPCLYYGSEISEMKKTAAGVRGIKLQKNDVVEQVYLYTEGVETKVIYKEKELTLNRLKQSSRGGQGTKSRV